MEGHRRFADEPEPSWYTGQSRTPTPYESGVHDRPSGAFRLPQWRASDGLGDAGSYAGPDPSGSHALPPPDGRIPVRGPEYPTIRPGGDPSLTDAPSPTSSIPGGYADATSAYGGASRPVSAVASQGAMSSGPSPGPEPTTIVPPLSRFGRGTGESVYRARRPFSAVVLATVTVLLMTPVIRLLIQVTFVDDPSARGIVPAVLLTLGLPLTGFGLYRLATGDGSIGRDAWLRPPIAYLPVGLLLLLAAGLAVA